MISISIFVQETKYQRSPQTIGAVSRIPCKSCDWGVMRLTSFQQTLSRVSLTWICSICVTIIWRRSIRPCSEMEWRIWYICTWTEINWHTYHTRNYRHWSAWKCWILVTTGYRKCWTPNWSRKSRDFKCLSIYCDWITIRSKLWCLVIFNTF